MNEQLTGGGEMSFKRPDRYDEFIGINARRAEESDEEYTEELTKALSKIDQEYCGEYMMPIKGEKPLEEIMAFAREKLAREAESAAAGSGAEEIEKPAEPTLAEAWEIVKGEADRNWAEKT